nr:signal peptidase II [Spongiibacter nanhainus]
MIGVVIGLDQLSKYLAESMLSYARPVEILPVLNMTLHYNTGAAFSMLSDAGGWQRWLFTAIAVGVSVYLLVWLMRLRREQWLLSMSLAMIVGGALGNLIDRLHLGHVVDFISVHWGASYFPTFNVADAAISVGAVLLVLDTWLHPTPEHVKAGKPKEDGK